MPFTEIIPNWLAQGDFGPILVVGNGPVVRYVGLAHLNSFHIRDKYFLVSAMYANLRKFEVYFLSL